MITFLRRTFLFGAGAAAVAPFLSRIQAKAADATAIDFGAVLKYPFSVPALTYAYDANEPSIDAQTMQLHHDKHHAAYVSNLNAALKDHAELQPMALHEFSPTWPTCRKRSAPRSATTLAVTPITRCFGKSWEARGANLEAIWLLPSFAISAPSQSSRRTSIRQRRAYLARAGRWCWSIPTASYLSSRSQTRIRR